MTAEERNFRSTYYEKVGCRSVEEKKSLKILLEENPRNLNKLKQFCVRFNVPGMYRIHLWNIILNVMPVFVDSTAFVTVQRQCIYDDLLKAVHVIRIVDEQTPTSRIFNAMYKLESKKLTNTFNVNEDSTFVEICEVLLQLFKLCHPMEVYWIGKSFYALTLGISKDLQRLQDLGWQLLEKQDSQLYNHLNQHTSVSAIPLEKWMKSCFASLLAEPALIRIWDKICGGSKNILSFLFLVIFTSQRKLVLQQKNLTGILKEIEKIKHHQENSDIIVTQTIDMWQQNKEHAEFLSHR